MSDVISNEPVDTAAAEQAEAPAEKTYSEADIRSACTKAVREALDAYKKKSAKSDNERIADLEKELATERSLSYTREALASNGLPKEFINFVSADSPEATDDNIKSLKSFIDNSVKQGIEDALKSTKPAIFKASVPGAQRRRSLAEINDSIVD